MPGAGNRRDVLTFNRLVIFLLILLTLSAPENGRAQSISPEWVVNNQYRISISVQRASDKKSLLPVSADINFSEVFKVKQIKGRLDKNSIRVVRYDQSSGRAVPYQEGQASYEVPYQLSHDFFYQDSGKIWWRTRDSQETHFHIYFDTLENGPKPGPKSMASIGNGDNFRFNNGRPGPIDGSMSASVRYVDWDNDGKKDLLLGSSQTHEYGVPWDKGYIYFHKNIGTVAAPLFAPGLQLKTESGAFLNTIGGVYAYFELVDWDKDGDLDLVIGDSPRLHLVENTGQRDRDGLPIIKAARKVVEFPNDNGFIKGYAYRFFRMVDWEGDGDLDVLYSVYQQNMEPNCYTQAAEGTVAATNNRDNRNRVCYWPEVLELFELHENTGLNAKGEPIFAAPRVIKTARDIPLSRFGYGGADYVDWDHDGDLDLITTDMQNNPQGACRILFHENFGTRAKPSFLLATPVVSRAEDFGIDPNPYVVDWDGDGDMDLLLGGFEGWVKVYENKNPDPTGTPELEQEGRFVVQTHPKLTGGEQTRTVVADWNGNGVLDLIQGSGNGWVKYYENEGTNLDPIFNPPVRLKAAGVDIRFINGLRDCPQGPSEPNSGYTTPVVVDFDGDGDLDLIVGDMRGYQTYFENIGIQKEPKLAAGRTIQVGDEPRSLGWRNQVAVGDIDGDGKLELITTPFIGRTIYSFKPETAQDNPKILRVTRVDNIRAEDGQTLLPPHAGGNNNGDNMMKLADWDNDGDLDLFFSSVYYNWYYENTGTRTKPKFKDRGKIQIEGKDLVVTGHANSIDVVDWRGDGRKDLVMSGESGWTYYFDRSFIDGDLPKTATSPVETRPNHMVRK